ncbi:bifunctional diguanylate cyclase/phosphodiesterase [Aromatoleum buckelii]|uniref:EAL domain-containing protein n=1 Tax=Aromatoleum buckelii TaxID=200254 RepID=A0ABX1N7A0_9RHOO|nr:EAL domain-containing protein [Aromatoleum buckelii]MCK0512781.1 EAL domain-containing protein [Aromatoleum buckelii]
MRPQAPRRRTIRSTVVLLVVACILPAWLLAAIVIYLSYERERAAVLDQTREATHTLLRLVERDIAANQAALETLAASEDIDRSDHTEFYRQAKEVLRHTAGFTIVLTDASGRQLLNLLQPLGSPLPQHANPALLRRVFETGMPMVSGVYVSRVTQTPVVSLEVPVIRDEKVLYSLGLRIELKHLGELMQQQGLPPGRVAVLLDSEGRRLARSPADEKVIGQKTFPALLEASQRQTEGSIEAVSRLGIPFVSFFSRSTPYGWTAAVGVRQSALTAGLGESLRQYAVGALVLLLGGLALAGLLGRRIARPMQALVAPALAIGRGEPVSVPPLALEEADEVGRALAQAQELLHQREADRAQAEEKLALAATALDSAVEGVVIARGGRIATVNRAFTSITGYRSAEVIGQPLAILLAEAEKTHRNDRRRAMCETGQWQGEVRGRRKNGEMYPAWSSISRAAYGSSEMILVCVFSDISAAKQYEARLQHLAHYDALTELPNRLLFRERLADMLVRAERHGNMLALLFIDLDGFKPINDTLGHEAGDELLRRVAERLGGCVRASDTTARLGGDEFAVLLDELRSPEEAGIIARNILDALERPYILAGQPQCQYISASIGIGCYPSDSLDAETLLRQADMAMYRAKQEGKNRYRFFAPEINAQASERLFMANSLRTALDRDELKLVFQPCMDLATLEVAGVEALVRWEHPQKGTILPSRFISLAEESGLIEPIGEWVLREAARRVREWKNAGIFAGRVAVNLSPRQFRRSDLASRLLAMLGEAGLAPRDLELEVTEGMIMEHPERAVVVLTELVAAGVSISIDDFGTGYSSLAYLKRFPVHSLKIDRSFVSGLPADRNDRSLTRAVVALAKSLGLAVVAEGVEHAEQADFLRRIGCDFAQGHYFSRPLDTATLGAFLREARTQEVHS